MRYGTRISKQFVLVGHSASSTLDSLRVKAVSAWRGRGKKKGRERERVAPPSYEKGSTYYELKPKTQCSSYPERGNQYFFWRKRRQSAKRRAFASREKEATESAEL
eukprot:3056644-Rhodomonas_salina.1